MALGLAATVAVATPALAQSNHSSKANKFLSLFSRAYNACSSTTYVHTPPLSYSACTPVEVSSTLKFGVKGYCQASGTVKLNTAKQATDVALLAKCGEVLDTAKYFCTTATKVTCFDRTDCQPPSPPSNAHCIGSGDPDLCCTGAGTGTCAGTCTDSKCSVGQLCNTGGANAGYSGTLLVTAQLRVTDHYCPADANCTGDTPFPVPLPCTLGKCNAKTSANTIASGAVVAGKQGNVEIGQLQIYNGANLFAVEGLWLP
jgi:hypothetical protein